MPEIFTILENREELKKYENVQGPLNDVTQVLYKDDVLYVLTSASECLIAFDLEGNALYTVYLFPGPNINKMVFLSDGTMVIHNMGNGYLKFLSGEYIGESKENTPEYDLAVSMLEKLNLEGLGEDTGPNGETYLASFGSVFVKDSSGNLKEFASNKLLYSLTTYPFPSVLYIIIGAVILTLMRKKQIKDNEEHKYLGPDYY
jgi:hypothetical protein